MYYNENRFLNKEQFESFNSFIKETGLTRNEIALLDGNGKAFSTITYMLSIRKIKITFANRIVQTWIKNQKIAIEKYKDLDFKILSTNN